MEFGFEPSILLVETKLICYFTGLTKNTIWKIWKNKTNLWPFYYYDCWLLLILLAFSDLRSMANNTTNLFGLTLQNSIQSMSYYSFVIESNTYKVASSYLSSIIDITIRIFWRWKIFFLYEKKRKMFVH